LEEGPACGGAEKNSLLLVAANMWGGSKTACGKKWRLKVGCGKRKTALTQFRWQSSQGEGTQKV